MARSPFEKFNVFDEKIQQELRNRRKSTNLLEVRSPFLRYTTTVEFPTEEWHANLAKLGGGGVQEAYNYLAPFDLGRYNGCKFFTLGVHGFEDETYDRADMYGTRANKGLVVGTTYQNNQQILVRTYAKEINEGMDNNFESPRGFPPPGIESATVERLRNGNVLKFTINAVCYTRQQLEMLDLLAFSPGMTCVLEWGNIISTPYGGQIGLKKETILDFKDTEKTESQLKEILEWHKGGIRRQNITKGARTKFIEEYCEKNNFHYDFAVARIANVKTSVENEKYKVTAIAYGVADNIMYISAYATNNPDIQEEANKTSEQQLITSVREYFSPKSKFSVLLDSMLDDYEIVKFDEPDDAANKAGPGAAAGSGTPTNDLGQEQTFYITLNKFINFFLNDPVNGIASIINKAVNITDASKSNSLEIIDGLDDEVDGVLRVGYNEVLRSTDPSVLLIANKKAIDSGNGLSATKMSIYQQSVTLKPEATDRVNRAEQLLKANQFQQVDSSGNFSFDGKPSGIASAKSGIWLNSKAIQSIFLEARTVHEGMETLLNKINAATEGYWDLSLMWDEQKNNFRIVDNNLKIPPVSANDRIYTFNKNLPTNADTFNPIDGSEVLDIKINADYPKLLVSQLGISAISNSSGTPNRRDLQYGRNPLMGPRLFDLLRKEQETSPPPPIQPAVQVCSTGGVTLNNFVEVSLKSSLYDNLSSRQYIKQYLGDAGFDTLPENVRQALQQIFSIQRPLSTAEAQNFSAQISSAELTDAQINSIKTALGMRLKAIVVKAKQNELAAFENGTDYMINRLTKTSVGTQISQVKDNIKQSKEDLLKIITEKTGATGDSGVVSAVGGFVRNLLEGLQGIITTIVKAESPGAVRPSQNAPGGIGR